MSVFDPNTDYTSNANDPTALYNTVMEVQKVLQEITSLLQTPEESKAASTPPKKPLKRAPPPQAGDSESEDSPEPQSTIYDNVFD
jgi:hypothetical protein